MLRATPTIEALPSLTPFVGPEQLMREGGRHSILRLGANESSFGPSPKALRAMASELSLLSRYGDPQSYDLREELAGRLACDIENIAVGSGIDDLMGLAVRAFVAPGALALSTRGTYPTFAYHVAGYGGVLETVDYSPNGQIDSERLRERVQAVRPAIIYLANPDNPSGTLVPRDQIERLLESLPAETLFVLDEAYAEFAPAERFLSGVIDPRLLRLRTFSKAYGMAGARIGYAVGPKRLIETFEKIRLHFGVNRNAQVGALAALRDQAFVDEVVAEVARGRREYYDVAADLGRSAIESYTNFVCIDYGSAQRATATLNALFDLGVFVRKPFALPLDGHIRVTVGTPEERLRFVRALRSVDRP